jgi:hypothetical protein
VNAKHDHSGFFHAAASADLPAVVTCSGLPTGGDADWAATCNGQAAGSNCTGTCTAGFTGSPAAACGNNGTWTVTSSCVQGE